MNAEARLSEGGGWRPIGTIPSHGHKIEVCRPDGRVETIFANPEWTEAEAARHFSEWRPMDRRPARRTVEVSHTDLCRLSQVFCDATGPSTAQDVRINAWIGTQIANAVVDTGRLALSQTEPGHGG